MYFFVFKEKKIKLQKNTMIYRARNTPCIFFIFFYIKLTLKENKNKYITEFREIKKINTCIRIQNVSFVDPRISRE